MDGAAVAGEAAADELAATAAVAVTGDVAESSVDCGAAESAATVASTTTTIAAGLVAAIRVPFEAAAVSESESDPLVADLAEDLSPGLPSRVLAWPDLAVEVAATLLPSLVLAPAALASAC